MQLVCKLKAEKSIAHYIYLETYHNNVIRYSILADLYQKSRNHSTNMVPHWRHRKESCVPTNLSVDPFQL